MSAYKRILSYIPSRLVEPSSMNDLGLRAGLTQLRVYTPFVRQLLYRAARRRGELSDFAVRSWTLGEGRVRVSPPAVRLPGQDDKILKLSPWRSWDVERDLIAGNAIEDAPTLAHEIHDVRLEGGHLYKDMTRTQVGATSPALFHFDPSSVEHVDKAAMCSGWTGSQYFGNHLLDDMPLGLLENFGFPRVRVKTKPYPDSEGYRRLLELPSARTLERASVQRLIVYSDFAQNESKAQRYRVLRAALRRRVHRPGRAPVGVFLLRNPVGGERRVLVNEDEIAARLEQIGFDCVDTSQLSAEETATRILNARFVVSVEGSHISHAIYPIADGGSFLVLQPPERFALAYKEYADRMDMRFGFVVGDPRTDGFTVRPDDVERTLELLEASTPSVT